MAKDPYRYFRVEARELVDQLGKGVLALEQDGHGAQQVALLLRWAHTLKGAARVVRQAAIADLIHGVEEVLTPLRDGNARVPRSTVDRLLAVLDQVSVHLAGLPLPGDDAGVGGGAGPPPAPPPARRRAAPRPPRRFGGQAQI
ncbi:Hpt domain-containing protein, partial [Massilia sp. BJB1822]|uniref:Hpt domain-containing protein n=1 Tax=Massilia sp. BJB1822 TaxID=2744470 RepID=UPI0015944C4E